MSKHTPGPWTVDAHDPTCVARNEMLILRCFKSAAHSHNGTCKDLDAEANARLIAAAPEMLDLLEVLARTLCDVSNDASLMTRDNAGEFSEEIQMLIARIESGAE